MTAAVDVISRSEILQQFRRSKSGIAGAAILFGLILMTIYAAVAVPLESYRQWNNPNFWIDTPKSAAPAWTNLLGPKMPEHIVKTAKDAAGSVSTDGATRTLTHSY